MYNSYYKFVALNSPSIYAYGTSTQVDRYEDYLNKDREENYYIGWLVTDQQAEDAKLDSRDDVVELEEFFECE